MQDLRRIHFVTEHYPILQGLRIVPLGLWFFIAAAGSAGLWSWFENWRPVSHGLSLAAVVLLNWLIGRYYRHTFGQVHNPTLEQQEKRLGIFMMGTVIAAIIADWLLQWPISLLALSLGGVFLAYYLSQHGRYRRHHLFIAALFFGLGLSPLLLGVTVRDPIWGSGGVAFQLALGASLILAGVLDHLLLVGTLQPLPEDDHGGTF